MSDFSNLTPAEKAELVDLVIAQLSATSKVAFKPIDMDNLEHLDETGGWPAEIVQLMPGNAVSAGAPDPANNKGTINWPLQDLAKRTSWLKAALHGMGGQIAEVANLDTLDKTCQFFFKGTAVGAPDPGYDGRGWHLQSDGEATQVVVIGSNKMLFRDQDTGGSGWTAWRSLLTDIGATTSYYSIADAPNGWLIGENLNGDTAVGLGEVAGHCHRIGNLAHISLLLDLESFSMPTNSDGGVQTSIDINEIASFAGWFSELDSSGLGVAYARYVGSGWDAPWMQLYCSANKTAGTLYVSSADTSHIPAQSSNATKLEVKLNITVLVKD